MAHSSRTSFKDAVPEDARQAGVLALFYPRDEAWHLVLIERESHNPRDRHRGQISFPGGGVEAQDRSLADTALREAEEEVGIAASSVRLLGGLSSLYIPVSNFEVHPFVGFVETKPSFNPQPKEVHAVLEVAFHHFQEPKHRGHTTVTVADTLKIPNVPYFDVHGKVVWGATAMILSELLEVYGNGPDETQRT